MARVAAARGARLALIGLEPDRLRTLADDLGPDASWWEADVRDGAALRSAIDGCAETMGGIDIVIADEGHRLKTAQNKAALRSLFELKDAGDTGSIDLYFGPRVPTGQEERWIQTVPGRGWFAYFRVYGPQGPAFDGSWKPGDFEALETRH